MGSALSFLFALLFCATSARAQAPFLAGADFSHLAFYESRGVVYKDNGAVDDGLAILKRHGINCVRLRLFTSSPTQAANDPYDYINNLAYNLPLALRVKNAGLLFLLDFHYSDTWADPGKQATPSTWDSLTFPELVQQMRAYNSNTVARFAAEGAMPDYVQIGNEITSGMLWPFGKVPGSNRALQWSQLGQLMKAAVQGIQDAAGANMPKIIVHIDRGGDWNSTKSYFDNVNAQGVPFDIIGESYYPFFQGPISALANCLTNAAARYGKPIVLAETAFPWTNTYWSNAIEGFAPTSDGQMAFLAAEAQVVKGVPNHLGAGVFYWGAEYQAVPGVNEAGFDTASFFDTAGNVLPAIDAVAGMGAPLQMTAVFDGTSLQLQWPLSGAAAQLVASPSVDLAGLWTPVTNSPAVVNSGLGVTLPVAASRFYRLRAN
ncbi:MAG TPA: glycosyl hydrolase 53 family protein [Verrucomicrobiae bacterium]|nr:glycosyl hydrolase 53 family protein [Verrucomicrobiae bacterium]